MPSPQTAIGIDIGGTKIAVALIDHEGLILQRHAFPTDAAQGFNLAVERIGDSIRQFDGLATPRTAPVGIGIACAGPVDPQRGLINNPFTLAGWNHCDIVSPLRNRFGVPVLLENDADAAAIGEAWVGAGRDRDPVVMLTFGTGVGGAIIHRGVVGRGVDGEHPELGHLIVHPGGPSCYCGASGCLEAVASGTAIAAAGAPHGLTSAREVFDAADAGNPHAKAIVEKAVDAVAIATWTLFHTLLPQRLILGGGIMDTEFHRFAGAARRLDSATQFTRSKVDLERAALGNDAGLLGAARLAFLAAEAGGL
ncbi:MAG: ROK family protein [Verrucomicrobiales bacterium]|nr:ROK family protein [Verrucomicrobiales bacterium]